jgi:CBS domain-containing protein
MFEWLKKIFRLRAKKERKNVKLVKRKRSPKPKLKPKIRLKKKKKVEKKVLLVSDLMTRNIIPVYSNQNLSEVAKLFMEKNISGAPVLDKNLFVGEISKTDILQIAGKQELSQLTKEDFDKLEKIMVYEVMKKPICILESETVEKAKKMMDKFKIRRLLVIDKKKRLIGIMTRTDLLKGESKERIKERIYTKIDEMVKMIETESLDVSTISKRLNVPENLIEEWAKILEESGLIEINYRAIGSPILKFKK